MPKLRGIKVWDDWRSVVHTALGVTTAFLPGWGGGLVATVFMLYEAYESPTEPEFLGDTIEFVAGLITAGIINYWLLLFA